MAVLRLIQKQTRLTLFYPLKDSKNLFYKKTPFSCNSLILSEFPFVYYLFFHFNMYVHFFPFFVLPDTLDFQCLVIVIF